MISYTPPSISPSLSPQQYALFPFLSNLEGWHVMTHVASYQALS